VVLATNVAETSITIPDVVYVVDGGRHKQRTYDAVNKLSVLSSAWVSKASAEQRKCALRPVLRYP
jgi:HrpA-like RNA helicase